MVRHAFSLLACLALCIMPLPLPAAKAEPPANAPLPIVRMVRLYHVRVETLDCAKDSDFMRRALAIDGITSVTPLHALRALIVHADSENAWHAFQQFIAEIDTPEHADALSASPAKTMPAPPLAGSFIGRIPLQHTADTIMLQLGAEFSQGLPDDIESITPMLQNTLLVRTKTKDAFQRLSRLISRLDQPRRSIIVEVLIVRVDNDTLPALSETTAEGLRGAIERLITERQAQVVNAPRMLVENGGTAVLPPFGGFDQVQGLLISDAAIHPDSSVSLTITPLFPVPGDQAQLKGSLSLINDSHAVTIHVRDGDASLLWKKESETHTIALLVRPTLVREQTELQPLF